MSKRLKSEKEAVVVSMFTMHTLIIVTIAVLSAAFFFWTRIEQALRFLIAYSMGRKLGVKVTLDGFGLSPKRIELQGLTVHNGPGEWKVPHVLFLELARIRTKGLLGLFSLPGLARFGPRGEFALGSLVRDVEEIEVVGLRFFLEEETAGNTTAVKRRKNASFISKLEAEENAKKKKKLEAQIKFQREFRKRWLGSEAGSVAAGEIAQKDESEERGSELGGLEADWDAATDAFVEGMKSQERSQAQSEAQKCDPRLTYADTIDPPAGGFAASIPIIAKLKELEERLEARRRERKEKAELQNATKSLGKTVGMRVEEAVCWRVGRLALRDLQVSIKGHTMVLESEPGFEMRALVGNDREVRDLVLFGEGVQGGLLAVMARDTGSASVGKRVDKLKAKVAEKTDAVLQATIGKDATAKVQGKAKELKENLDSIRAIAAEKKGEIKKRIFGYP